MNADLYLPSITEDNKGNKASKLGECCQGLVNLELMIHHLSSLDNVEKNQMYVDLSAVKSDDDIIRVVSGKSLLKIISRIHSAAAMAVFDAGEERNDTYIAFVNKAYNNLAKLKVDGKPRYSDNTLKTAREKLLKCLYLQVKLAYQ